MIRKLMVAATLALTPVACLAEPPAYFGQSDRSVIIMNKHPVFCGGQRVLILAKDSRLRIWCAGPAATAITLSHDNENETYSGLDIHGDALEWIASNFDAASKK